MRLFDKLLARKRAEFLSGLDAASVVVLANDPICEVASREWLHGERERGLDPERFPFCRPPFTHTFTESNAIANEHHLLGDAIQYGALTFTVSKETVFESPEVKKECEEIYNSGSPDCYVTQMFVNRENEKIMVLPPQWMWGVSSDGGISRSRFLFMKHSSISTALFNGLFQLTRYIFECTLLSFTFLNCSNVKLEDVTINLQPDRKTRKRLNIPDVKRYTLNIAGHVSVPSKDARVPSQGIMPFHLCRGHFATYTADKPLFGNPKNVGRFWIPPHTKGKKERGEVIKDYAITGDA